MSAQQEKLTSVRLLLVKATSSERLVSGQVRMVGQVSIAMLTRQMMVGKQVGCKRRKVARGWREKRKFNKKTGLHEGWEGTCTYIRDIHGRGHTMTWNRNS